MTCAFWQADLTTGPSDCNMVWYLNQLGAHTSAPHPNRVGTQKAHLTAAPMTSDQGVNFDQNWAL